MTTNEQKQLIALVRESIEQHGSQSRAAVALGVNPAYITHIMKGELDKVSEAQWTKITLALGYNPNAWTMVQCVNTMAMDRYLTDAKTQGMMLAISSPAGSGKTSYARHYERTNRKNHVYMLECGEWRAKTFLNELCHALGIATSNYQNRNAQYYLSLVVEYLASRSANKPLLILDEFADLRPCAFRAMKTLYNRLEDRVGIVMMATEHLEKDIERGVARKAKGYDEVSSRLGRKFLRLYGMRKQEVIEAAKANGVADKEAHKRIWLGCEPRQVEVQGRFFQMATDLRRMKRLIKQERLRAVEA